MSLPTVDRFSWYEGGAWHHGPLSNGFIEPDGSHVEGEYQAYAKTVDEDERRAILWMPGEEVRRPPFGRDGAKRAGRKVKLRPDHDQIKVPVMAFFVARKFREHEVLRDVLIDTGDAELVEGNSWCDQLWGSCWCSEHRGVPGMNWLGVILMSVRATL